MATFTTQPTYNTDLPNLNTDMILDLIDWAQRSEDRRLTLDEVEKWGWWDQGSWGYVTSNTDVDGVRINWSSMGDEDKEKVRNGVCKTAFCMAGDAAVRAGYRFDFPNFLGGEDYEDGAAGSRVIKQRPTGRFTPFGREIWEDDPSDGGRYDAEAVGQRAIGLASDEAEMFFSGNNTLEMLREMANRFAMDRRLPLLFPNSEVYS